MQYQFSSIYCLLHLVIVCYAAVPEYPNIAQWKVPLFHKRDKYPVTSIRIVPQVSTTAAVSHQQTKEYVKKLEYNVQNELRDSSSVAVQILDLNGVIDEEFAIGVEKDVLDELDVIDKEAGIKVKPADLEMRAILQMHQGHYKPSPQYNLMIDGLIKHVQKIAKRRDMDPLHFSVHKRGIVRHVQRKSARKENTKTTNDDSSAVNNQLGGGVISGLGKLKRFGNPEFRKGQNGTMVRSHFFFGPLNIDFVFAQEKGLFSVNSTLSSLAAHALFDASNPNQLKLVEFLIDSPMDYEIRMKGARNARYRSLSQSAITRLFRRNGRMEKRLQRAFVRAADRPLDKIMKGLKAGNNIKNKKKKQTSKINKKVTGF